MSKSSIMSSAGLAALIAAGVLAAPQARAVPLQIERYTYTYVTPLAADFSGSSYVYNNTINFDSGDGTLDNTLTFQSGASAISIYGLGGTTVAPSTAPDGTGSLLVSITSPGGSGQGWGFDYDGLASATPGLSFLTYGSAGGVSTLAFNGGGSNFVDMGGRFLSTVVMQGDWSDPGSHSAATYAPGYSVFQDFVYDAATDRTIFSVETASYATGVNPSIAFTLLGAAVPVPEPASVALLGGGLLVLWTLRRRA